MAIDALDAFYARAGADATLQGLLGTKASGKARVYPQFPDTVLAEEDYPRVTYFMVTGGHVGLAIDEILIQADIWVWPTGVNGGPGRLGTIDAQMLVLFHGSTNAGAPGIEWSQGGGRIFSRSVSWRDFPTAPDEPLRRRRDYRLRVS